MAWRGGELTVQAAAQRLSTALGLQDDLACSAIHFSTVGNTGAVFLGPSTVTITTNRRAAIPANTAAATIGPTDRGCLALGEVYFCGTASDKLLVGVLER